ncbi:MAG: UDP-N-acetylmuramate--L-alanine ligase [bacterium]|nr:UDP-N-acetylmuramate--L-alanine ligase [bacterium]
MVRIRFIHFVGIKGVGMTPLAIIAKEAGCKVTGSDIEDEFITDISLKKAGIIPFVNFLKEHVGNVDLVITTGAHGGFENIEVQYAKSKNIPVMTQGEAVGVFMDGKIFNTKFIGISITGSHGKTTTSAMIATIFKENHLDPSYLVGSGSIFPLDLPGHFGKGNYFIAEADEYATEPKYDKTPKFLWQHPKIEVFTNIEFDHPDFFNSLEEIKEAFLNFAKQLPRQGLLVGCGDDQGVKEIIKKLDKDVITYGFSPLNDYQLIKVNSSFDQTFFWVEKKGISLGEFNLGVSGEHNALNALGATVVALEIGIPLEKIKNTLKVFKGTKRRLEYVGKLPTGALLFDDYAHHPTEIQQTLKAFRQDFPKSKIVCIFQPHTYSRTKKLFEDFICSFNNADEVAISNIYPSLREKPDSSVSSKLLVEGISKFHKNVLFLPELKDVVEYIEQKAYSKDVVVLTMGAGDIYKISQKLIPIKSGLKVNS